MPQRTNTFSKLCDERHDVFTGGYPEEVDQGMKNLFSNMTKILKPEIKAK